MQMAVDPIVANRNRQSALLETIDQGNNLEITILGIFLFQVKSIEKY